MGEIVFSSNCFFMSRGGLSPLCALDCGCSILDVTGVLAKVEEIRPCDIDGLIGIRVINSQKYDSVGLDTPYMVYDKRSGAVEYVRARNLKLGMCLLSVKPTMKYAKTCYSMDMQDFVTCFGKMKSVTINKVTYTLRPITDLLPMDSAEVRGYTLKLKHTVTAQTANGIVKTWSV